MRTLNRLFQLHLITEQDDILRATRNRNGISKRNLSRFVDKKKVELVFPLGNCKEPRGSTNDTVSICAGSVFAALNKLKTGIRIEKILIFFSSHLNPVQRSAAFLRSLTASVEEIDDGLMTI